MPWNSFNNFLLWKHISNTDQTVLLIFLTQFLVNVLAQLLGTHNPVLNSRVQYLQTMLSNIYTLHILNMKIYFAHVQNYILIFYSQIISLKDYFIETWASCPRNLLTLLQHKNRNWNMISYSVFDDNQNIKMCPIQIIVNIWHCLENPV